MKRLTNYKNEDLSCIQFKGRWDTMAKTYAEIILANGIDIKLPQNLTIVIKKHVTDLNKGADALLMILDYYKIPYILSAENYEGEWNNIAKTSLAAEAIKNVQTEYALVLDSGNVVITPEISTILEKFKNTNKNILFTATAYRFPNDTIDVIPLRDLRGKFAWLGSGMVIGKTESLINFYQEAKDIAIKNPKMMEQAVYRYIFNKNQDLIDFDWETKIFYSTSWSNIEKKEDSIVFD